MGWRNEIVMRDVTNACPVISSCIIREVGAQLDLEDALEASRYASHPYTAHPREVIFSNFPLSGVFNFCSFFWLFLIIFEHVSLK